MRKKSIHEGFTLVELLSVVIIVGILSVTAGPRLLRTASFAEFTAQDQIIAAARLAQQRAMYDRFVNPADASQNACYRLRIMTDAQGVLRVGVQSRQQGYAFIGPDSEWQQGIAFDDAISVADTTLYFDGLGSAIGNAANCSGAAANTTIAITDGANTLNSVCIYSTGYIQKC